jgi:hypothetical protein
LFWILSVKICLTDSSCPAKRVDGDACACAFPRNHGRIAAAIEKPPILQGEDVGAVFFYRLKPPLALLPPFTV